MRSTTPQITDFLPSLARKREVLALAYGDRAVAGDSMIYWLARAAAQARENQERLQVHVAASLNRNQSTIARFELGETWPKDPDATIAAYADDLGIEPIELWTAALDMWKQAQTEATEKKDLGPRSNALRQPPPGGVPKRPARARPRNAPRAKSSKRS